MAKSPYAQRLDDVQALLDDILRPLGFRRRGRTWNRSVEPGVVHVVNLQMWPAPIGTRLTWLSRLIPWGQDRMYGRFAVNLGIYVREVHEARYPPVRGVVNEAHCAIRSRLEKWISVPHFHWSLRRPAQEIVADLGPSLLGPGLAFLERFATRDAIVRDWVAFNEGPGAVTRIARLDVAAILNARGDAEAARALFEAHLNAPDRVLDDRAFARHRESVLELAKRIGLGGVGA